MIGLKLVPNDHLESFDLLCEIQHVQEGHGRVHCAADEALSRPLW